MEKSFKRLQRCNSRPVRKRRWAISRAALAALALLSFHPDVSAKQNTSAAKSEAERPVGRLENHKDLILKAQNLSLQQDRLQASQVLIRGLQRETRGSQAYKELARALDELTGLFYTERAQAAFATGESLAFSKPREAVDAYEQALKVEDRNLTVLKALARLHLRANECDLADSRVRQAEETNPYSSEVKLLRLQVLSCQKNGTALMSRFAAYEQDLESVKKFSYGLRIKEYLRTKDLKKARALLSEWEAAMPDYPEIYYWKWEISMASDAPDRLAAAKYLQLCQGLSARKRNQYVIDVHLCKGKEAVETFLRENEMKSSYPSGTEGANP